jgi:hypothetical protein
MTRVAIFVDAGYLFAQGSVALTGEKRARPDCRLNETAVLAALAEVAKAKCDGVRVLRTYWYDAAPRSGPTAHHTSLAGTDYVKLRLGAMNGVGQQKGVDSLIVTDLIELARNRSISDAVLLSGDEDVRVGVQLAQNFGVAVHLIGIYPARGSQSAALRQESDTTTEWDKDTIARFLTVSAPLAVPVAGQTATARPEAKGAIEVPAPPAPEHDTHGNAVILRVVDEVAAGLDTDALASIESFWSGGGKGLPSEIDRPMLAKLADAFGRRLEQSELRLARQALARKVKR